MNYPIWELPTIGGGSLIAIIAILHVFIAHLAVGGGLFLVLTEHKARKNNDQALLQYVKSHTKFFLLLTMVFGGITGVGIWFIISLVNPAGTSALIHTFVFGWATEWVFFIGEIVALLIYHYRFDTMRPKDHMTVGWLYFIFAWLSLFIINGIIGFMLTPGSWLETESFWQGFFNPSFLPSLIFRTGIALSLAGMFGLVTATFRKDKGLRQRLYKLNTTWMLVPFALIVLSALWYMAVIPEGAVANITQFNPEVQPFINILIATTILIFLAALLFLVKLPVAFQRIAVFILVLIGLGWMSGFEYTREIARKPYVIYGYMYSNGVLKTNADTINQEGFLKTAKWTQIKEVTHDNLLAAGKELADFQCMACHTRGGHNDIISRTDHLTERGMEAKLTGLGQVNDYMPPFFGTNQEKEALAAYLVRELHDKKAPETTKAKVQQINTVVPEFNAADDEYVLLAWNDLGMHCISDNSDYWSFLPPANTLWAQLIKRGPKPEVVSEGVKLHYEVEEGFRNPEKHVDFWKNAKKTYGADLEEGIGLAGKGMMGEMDPNVHNTFVAHFIPVTPYKDDGTYNPYPLFDVTAIDEKTGEKLAFTKVVAPTSTEMGCRNCHQGGWRVNDFSGMADLTSENVLKVHDRIEGTQLAQEVANGNPVLCQSCHGDPAIGVKGKKQVLNFSTAIHGFHANYLKGMDGDACNLCHPNMASGNTKCLRGRHAKLDGMDCTTCHGKLEDHALGLLKHEDQFGKHRVKKLRQNLQPRSVESYANVNPRQPWLQEPDCKSCHTNFNIRNITQAPSGFNKWVAGGSALYRNRTDTHGVMCAACHGSPHAVYAANNMYGEDRDNIQPIQYMGIAGTLGTKGNCKVCHTIEMSVNGHHRNMLKNNPKVKQPAESTIVKK